MVTDQALPHLQAEYRLNSRLSLEERLRWMIQDRWINDSRADKILTRLEIVRIKGSLQRVEELSHDRLLLSNRFCEVG